MFIRLGNDFDQNYYEYEVPVTPSAFFNRDPYNVWPEANNMIIEFAKLNDLKMQRDQSGAARNQPLCRNGWRSAGLREGKSEPEPDAHDHDRYPQPEA